MAKDFSQSDLEAYLDESLASEEMARIEDALRAQPELAKELVIINSRRDAGVHSIGAVWRRHRISCPSREQLGSYLLGALSDAQADYITFHIERIGCRLCRANLEDLRSLQQEEAEIVTSRRQKYFQSSAGYLRRKD